MPFSKKDFIMLDLFFGFISRFSMVAMNRFDDSIKSVPTPQVGSMTIKDVKSILEK